MTNVLTGKKKRDKYEFAILAETLLSKKEVFTPVVRRKQRWFPNRWERITCIYGIYTLMELDWKPELTYDECVNHIDEYQKVLEQKVANEVDKTVYHELEVKQF